MNNILCLTGDHQKFGNHPAAKGVYDLDSVQLIKVVKDMRDEKKLQCGDEIDVEPRLFIGAAANPFAAPFEFRVVRLAKKVAAGADFIQTQVIYDIDKFAEWMMMVRDRGLHEKVKILAGVAPIRSSGAVRYMKTKVPGMDVPQKLVDRMDAAVENIPDPKTIREPEEKNELSRRRREAWEAEGIKICQEIIQQVCQIEGVAGIHITAVEWEEVVPEIVKAAGLLPRPRLVT
jgi:methylenetetrahydrofolate reductase (NADPH)